jgi:P-type Ca2+ transporter type 2C
MRRQRPRCYVRSQTERGSPRAETGEDAVEMRVKASKVVAGDILLLSGGDKVPADARLLEAFNLKSTSRCSPASRWE